MITSQCTNTFGHWKHQEFGQTKHNRPDFKLYSIIACRLGNVQGRNSLREHGRMSNPYLGPPTTVMLVLQGMQWIILSDHAPGPTWSPFMACSARGVYYYPDTDTQILIPCILDLHPEAGYTFAPFWDSNFRAIAHSSTIAFQRLGDKHIRLK